MLKGAWDEKLDLPEGADMSNLKVTVEVKYNRYSLKSDAKAREWMDQLARASRHFDPEDTVIETASGKTITGDELRLKASCDHFAQFHNQMLPNASAPSRLLVSICDFINH